MIKKEIQDGCLPPEASALIQEKPRCSRFYMLPKIHKVDNPGRPIVSTCNCPTECMSSFTDDVLQLIVVFLYFAKIVMMLLLRLISTSKSVYHGC